MLDRDTILWLAGGGFAVISALLGILYRVHSDRIDAKADAGTVKALDERIALMHEENKSSSDRMESRFRQDYAMLNANISQLTGRVDQVLTQLSRRTG